MAAELQPERKESLSGLSSTGPSIASLDGNRPSPVPFPDFWSSAMSATTRLTRLALASAIALAATQAHASVRLSEAFDGAWFDPAASGRGVLVDFIPNASRTGGTLFAADFVYDNAGNPFWITLQQNWSEFQYTSTNVPIFRAAAGTWPTPGASTNTQIGTATFTINSCNSITVSYAMDAGSGFANRTQTLERLGGVDGAACAYQQAFTACPSFATAAPAYGPRACNLPSSITSDITLTNDITWVMNGKVGVGVDGGAVGTLRIQPGTLLISTGVSANSFDHVSVARGSKIFALGTRDFPVIMTTANELPNAPTSPAAGQVGGLAVAGRAPVNCTAPCAAEWDSTVAYGGNDPKDSSGEIRYMQVRYSGYVFRAGSELNAFTFAGVGSGTLVEYTQSYRGQDDGYEFFGGNVNVRYSMVTCPGDDSYDWDIGYTGKIQFAVVDQRGCSGEDHGLELANNPNNGDALPRARGVMANVTLRGNPAASRSTDGFNLKEGTGGNFYNVLVEGFKRSCITIDGTQTSAASGDPGIGLTGVLTGNNIKAANCGTTALRESGGVAASYTSQWFNSQAGNELLSAGVLKANSYLPNGLAPTGQFPPAGATAPGLNDWFIPTNFVGAFRSDADADNWALGWTRPFSQ